MALRCSICRKMLPDIDVAALRAHPSDVECQCDHTMTAIAMRKVAQGPDISPWTPTPEAINALPEGVRSYVHDLETRSDQAGDVRARVLAEDRVAELEAALAIAREEFGHRWEGRHPKHGPCEFESSTPRYDDGRPCGGNCPGCATDAVTEKPKGATVGSGTTAARIADRVTLAHIGRPPTDTDDPAHDEWWKLHSDVARAAEDEIGRAKLLQSGNTKDVVDAWRRLTALGPLDAVTVAQAAAFDQLSTAIRRVGAGG